MVGESKGSERRKMVGGGKVSLVRGEKKGKEQ